jgi:hypothetical protein
MSVTIVGAGPGGLSVALALRCHDRSLPLTVLDPSGTWLAAWRRRFTQQDIPHLRSPAVHHPHPDPFALLARTDRRGLVPSGGTNLPTTAAFERFCDELVEAAGLAEAVRPVGVAAIESTTPGDVRIRLSDGQLHGTDRLVLATNARRPLCPPALADATAEGAAVGSERADVRATPPGGHVVVVGGGLSAAHLALGAARRGAHVTLLTRRRLTVRRFDTHPTWLGPRKLRPFVAEPDPLVRRRAIDAARGGGTVPHAFRRELARCEERGLLTLRERSVIVGCERDAAGRLVLHLDVGPLPAADAVWVATGGRIDVTDDPLCVRLVDEHPTPVADGLAVLDDDLSWPGTGVHLVGFTAALSLGPTAGNLIGLRRGAQRVAAAVRGEDPVQADRITTGGGACPDRRLRAQGVTARGPR